MRRTIWFWISFVAAIILAVYFSVRIITTLLGHGNIAVVHNINISADDPDADMNALRVAAALPPNSRAFDVNLEMIAARVDAVPTVRAAAVRRMPNGNISVRAKIYKAVALWSDGDLYYPLSADGTIINDPTDTRTDDAVVFRGTVPDDISDITAAAHMVGNKLGYLEWIEGRRWNLVTQDGVIVMLPEEDPVGAIGTLLTMDKNHKILSRDIRALDMRDAGRMLVK